MTLRLYPRLTLDLSVRDLAYAVAACARQPDAACEASALESEWAPAGDGLVALSVRSAFDLYLSALALPAGSEILLSGVTIPDMGRIVREHGLIPVPVDVALETLFPSPIDCERAWSPNVRLLVIAHLFGGRNDLTPIAAWARARGIPLVEDCAQAFRAPDERGSPLADATFYSFGSIKTMTALGGALVRVADAQVLARMRAAIGERATKRVSPSLNTRASSRRMRSSASLGSVLSVSVSAIPSNLLRPMNVMVYSMPPPPLVSA